MRSLIFKILGIGGKPVYRSVQRSPQAINQIRKKHPNAELIQKPSQSIIAAAKPFKPISGAGSRTVPSRAQQAERAAQAASVKPTTQTGGSGRPPARVSGPPQRSGARKQEIVVAKPRQVTTAVRPSRPPAKANTGKGTTPAPRPVSPARRTLNPAMRAAIAAMAMKQSAPTGVPKSKAETMPMPTPKPKSEEFDQKTPRKPAPVTPPKETTNFDAGKNTGFGPKGNIFPSSSEERAALMVMYGGTGSKAGKAAIAGTQGNLAKGQSLLDAAKNKKRSNVGISSRANPALKKGGMVKKVPIITVGKGSYKGKVIGTGKKTISKSKGGKVSKPKKTEVVARQMRGWGKARKPKR